MSPETERDDLIDRREAIRRVTALLGGVALVGGSALISACERGRSTSAGPPGAFTSEDVALLDEIAETILPETRTPGAKAARVGPFMALMVTDTYDEQQQQIFREGIQQVDRASRDRFGAPFMKATPQQRRSLLEMLDREQKADADAREARMLARKASARTGAPTETGGKQADAYLPDERKENVPGAAEAGGSAAITAEPPPHYFRMMKELALLGYFTSEIGYKQVMRYVESPGRFDPCVPYTPGEPAWAPHA